MCRQKRLLLCNIIVHQFVIIAPIFEITATFVITEPAPNFTNLKWSLE